MSEPERVYLAGRWSRREEIERHAAVLRALGIIVQSRWLTDPSHRIEVDPVKEAAAQAFNAELAMHDWDDVHNADTFIYFSPGGTRGGCHVEFGMALALRKRVIVVGPREHVFTWMESVERFETWEACLEAVFRAAELDVLAPLPPVREQKP